MPGPLRLLTLLALLAGSAAAGEPLRVAAVEEAAVLRLEDGRSLRLAGVEAPLPEHREHAAALARALAELTAGEGLVLRPAAPGRDRAGRLLAQAFRSGDGLWLQAFLVRWGLARVDPFGAGPEAVLELLAEEAVARDRLRGLWADPAYRLRGSAPDQLLPWIGSLQVVEGRVRSVGEARGDLYLNFGEDWRQDTTARIERRLTPAFAAAGLTPETLAGRQVRLRGWLQDWNGPFVELHDPLQLELLPAAD